MGDGLMTEAELAQAAALGLTAEDFGTPEDLVIWPDNRDAVRVFLACDTQWRVVQGVGYTGIDYAALPEVWKARRIDKQRRPEVFDGLKVMEREVLKIQNQRRKA